MIQSADGMVMCSQGGKADYDTQWRWKSDVQGGKVDYDTE